MTRPDKRATLTQDDAGYVDHSVDGDQCSRCTMFQPPSGCDLVKGEIAADGHCDYFDPADPVTLLSPI